MIGERERRLRRVVRASRRCGLIARVRGITPQTPPDVHVFAVGPEAFVEAADCPKGGDAVRSVGPDEHRRRIEHPRTESLLPEPRTEGIGATPRWTFFVGATESGEGGVGEGVADPQQVIGSGTGVRVEEGEDLASSRLRQIDEAVARGGEAEVAGQGVHNEPEGACGYCGAVGRAVIDEHAVVGSGIQRADGRGERGQLLLFVPTGDAEAEAHAR